MAVSVQQAAVNAFAAFLRTVLTTDIVVSDRWPSPDKALPLKAITILQAGQRQDIRFEKNYLLNGNVGPNQVNALVNIMQCQQPLQLDVWAKTHSNRDDIIAQLDAALNSGYAGIGNTFEPVDHGCLVALADGYPPGTFADVSFDNPNISDDPDSVRTAEFRAMYRGDLYVMLSVPKLVARQRVIEFQATLQDGDVITGSTATDT